MQYALGKSPYLYCGERRYLKGGQPSTESKQHGRSNDGEDRNKRKRCPKPYFWLHEPNPECSQCKRGSKLKPRVHFAVVPSQSGVTRPSSRNLA